MAQFIDWGDWDFLTYGSGTDIDAYARADTESVTSDAVSLDGYAGAEVGVTSTEDDTGACDGNVEVYVCGTVDGTNYETIADAPWLAGIIDQVRNTTMYAHFTVSAERYSSFKVVAYNDSGQEVDITIKYHRSQLGSS